MEGEAEVGILYKYRYLIFFSVFVIVSLLLSISFIDAISRNTGKDYWDIFKEGFWVTFLAVFVCSGLVLFGVVIIAPTQASKGRGAFLAIFIVYIIAVAILGPVTYFGLLNFGT